MCVELGNHVRRAWNPSVPWPCGQHQLLDYLASESLCVTANWGTAYQQERAFADRQFVAILNAYHGKDNLCLITQDRALAQLLTELARQPTPGVRTRVAYIDHCNWYLREWTQRLKRVRDNSGPEGQAQPERRYPGETGTRKQQGKASLTQVVPVKHVQKEDDQVKHDQLKGRLRAQPGRLPFSRFPYWRIR